MEFGTAGPYVFWRTLEILATEDAIEYPFVCSWRVFCSWFPSISRKKLATILNHFADHSRFTLDLDSNQISIFSTKLTELSSDYAHKVLRVSEDCPSNIPPKIKIKKEIKKEKPPTPLVKTWRNDFETYKAECMESFAEHIKDSEWIKERQTFHPGLDIKMTLRKAVVDFWGVEGGWKNKAGKKSKTINWRNTWNNALSNIGNKVWLPKDVQRSQENPGKMPYHEEWKSPYQKGKDEEPTNPKE